MHPSTQQTLQAIERAVDGMAPDDWTRAPAGKWSAGHVLEHLDLTFSGTVESMRRWLEKGPRVSTASWRQRVGKWLIVHLGYFPRGFQAPEFVVPRGGLGETVLTNIRQHLGEMDEAIAACEQKLGPRTRFKHPRLGPLTAQQWRRFHLVHTRHHMKQVAALRARPRE
jgi:hypothetical protein